MDELIYVVGTAYVKDGKLLISMSQRSSKKGKFTLKAENKSFEDIAIAEDDDFYIIGKVLS